MATRELPEVPSTPSSGTPSAARVAAPVPVPRPGLLVAAAPVAGPPLAAAPLAAAPVEEPLVAEPRYPQPTFERPAGGAGSGSGGARTAEQARAGGRGTPLQAVAGWGTALVLGASCWAGALAVVGRLV